MKKHIPLILALTAAFTLASCDKDKPSTPIAGENNITLKTTDKPQDAQAHKPIADEHKDDHGHPHGPNGGDLKEIGTVGFIEYFIDEKQSSMTIYLYDKDGKTPLKVTQPPLVMGKLRTNRISEPFTAESVPNNKFQLTHAIFSAHVNLFIAVTLDGSKEPISISFPHHH